MGGHAHTELGRCSSESKHDAPSLELHCSYSRHLNKETAPPRQLLFAANLVAACASSSGQGRAGGWKVATAFDTDSGEILS